MSSCMAPPAPPSPPCPPAPLPEFALAKQLPARPAPLATPSLCKLGISPPDWHCPLLRALPPLMSPSPMSGWHPCPHPPACNGNRHAQARGLAEGRLARGGGHLLARLGHTCAQCKCDHTLQCCTRLANIAAHIGRLQRSRDCSPLVNVLAKRRSPTRQEPHRTKTKHKLRPSPCRSGHGPFLIAKPFKPCPKGPLNVNLWPSYVCPNAPR